MATQTTTQSDITTAARNHPANEGHLRESVDETVYELKSKLARAVDAGKTRVMDFKGGVDSTIREKPIQSVLIAAAVGTLIGILIGRRSAS